MNNKEFLYWLKGIVDSNINDKTDNNYDWELISNELRSQLSNLIELATTEKYHQLDLTNYNYDPILHSIIDRDDQDAY